MESAHTFYRERNFFSQEEREVLKRAVFKLVDKVRGNNKQFSEKNDFDVLFFLDKSARPLSWMFRCAWNVKFPGIPMPKIRFFKPFVLAKELQPKDKRIFELWSTNFGNSDALVIDDIAETNGTMEYAAFLLKKEIKLKSLDKFVFFGKPVVNFGERIFPWHRYKMTEDSGDLTLVEDSRQDFAGKYSIMSFVKRLQGSAFLDSFEARVAGLKLRKEIQDIFKYPN